MWQFNLITNYIQRKRGKKPKFYSEQISVFVESIKKNFPSQKNNTISYNTILINPIFFRVENCSNLTDDLNTFFSSLIYPNHYDSIIDKSETQ